MAKQASKKKKPAKSPKSSAKSVNKDVTLDEIETEIEEIALSDFASSTKKELNHLGEIIHGATDKSVHLVKEIAADVQKFARNATELTKLKIELHNLKEEKNKLYTLMGEQLSNLYKAQKLSRIKARFKADFAKLDELESDIMEREKMAKKISL